MGLSVKVGTRTTGTGTSNLTSASLGFTPKAVILFGVRGAGGAQPYARLGLSVGAFTSATERCAAAAVCLDAQTAGSTGSVVYDDACFALLLTPTGDDGKIDGVSLDADTFTVVPDNAFAASELMRFIAIGGSDVVAAKAGTITLGALTGNQTFTDPGFQPDVVFFFWARSNSVANTASANAGIGMGWAVSSAQRAAVGGASQDTADPTNSRAIVMTDKCIAICSAATDAIAIDADFVSFETLGFTINKTTGAGTPPIGYLALKGGRWFADTTTMRTDTDDQPVTGVGFTPRVVVLAARPPATATEAAPSAHFELCIGATDGTNQGSMWVSDEDALATSDTYSRDTSFGSLIDFDKETGATDEGSVAIGSFDADGFTLDQNVASAVETLIPFLVGGDNAGGSVVGTSTTQRTSRRRRR
jgi:hypothetical protein